MSHREEFSSFLVGSGDGDYEGGSTRKASPRVTVVKLRSTAQPDDAGRRLLWFDASAAALAGVTLLTLRGWLAPWFGVAVELVALNAIANLAYASYSGTLATLTTLGITPPRRALVLLVAANVAWPCVCATLIAHVWTTATLWAVGYLALEASFVGALAFVEYRTFLAVTARPRTTLVSCSDSEQRTRTGTS